MLVISLPSLSLPDLRFVHLLAATLGRGGQRHQGAPHSDLKGIVRGQGMSGELDPDKSARASW